MIQLVEVTGHRPGWKGTWYKTGQRHFVRENFDPVYVQRWSAVDICGGINDADCRVLRGPLVWLRCRLKELRQAVRI